MRSTAVLCAHPKQVRKNSLLLCRLHGCRDQQHQTLEAKIKVLYALLLCRSAPVRRRKNLTSVFSASLVCFPFKRLPLGLTSRLYWLVMSSHLRLLRILFVVIFSAKM